VNESVAGNHIGRIEQIGLAALSVVLGILPASYQARVASAYFNRRHPAPGQLLRRRMMDGTRMMLDIGDRMQSFSLLTRQWAPDLIAFAAAHLPRDGTFIDVGANVGLISLSLARQRPDVTVIAFEPHPVNANLWTQNHARNRVPNAHLEPVGLGDCPGPATMRLSSDLGSGYLTETGDIPVTLTTLDAYATDRRLSRIDVVKIDVEGSEPRVLDGALGLLVSAAARCVIVEINAVALARAGSSRNAVVERLTRHGYTPTPIPRIGAGGAPAEPNPDLEDLAFLAPEPERDA
jgi:FkbM family methyltransferase